MPMEFETSEDFGGGDGSRLDQPGTYHCMVAEMFESTSTKGKPIDGFSAMLTVLAGTTKDQEDKTYGLTLFSPDLSKNESSQKWSKRKQTAFVVAANAMDLSKMGQRVSIDLAQCHGHQIIIALANEEYQGETNLRLSYANIYHVDDPRAAKFPKDAKSIGRIENPYRHDAAYFEPILKAKSGDAKPKLSKSDLDSL